MSSNKDKHSFWTTIPGILTGIAAIIGAITTLLATGILTPPPSTNIAPLADAGPNKTVEEGKTELSLNGRGIDPNDDMLTYLWRQIAGEYPVKLENENKAIAIFDAPSNLTDDTKLIFDFSVDDRKGLTANDNVVITVLNNRSNDVMLYNQKGWTFEDLERYKEALDFHDKALSIDPNNYDGLNGKGWALVGLGNYTGAIKYFDKVLAIDPNHSYALGDKNFALDQLNKNSTSMVQQ